MTLADQLRQEGKLEGKVEGKVEGKIEGKLEGEREGLLRGKSEGQLRAFRTAVLRALEIRHGAYPAGIREAIDAINAINDTQRLEALLENAIRSNSIEEFAQKL